MRIARVAVGVGTLLSLAVARPVDASTRVVVDPSGDAVPTECRVVCTATSDESQPAADIVAVHVGTSAGQLHLDVVFVDIDRPIPVLGPESGVIWNTASFSVGDPGVYPWSSVHLQVQRDLNGGLASPSVDVLVSTNGHDDPEMFSRSLAGSASIDVSANRLRLAVSLDDLRRAVDEMCARCDSVVPGTTLSSFYAHSFAGRYVSAGLPLTHVDWNAARDTGWPRGSYVL